MSVAVFGVDSLPLKLIQAFPEVFPFLHRLSQEKSLKEIRSCDPPITIPAWSVITTGRDPGELGVYGFRNRRSYAVMDYALAQSSQIRYPRIWDRLGPSRRSFVMGVPQTYPLRPINGTIVAGILAPNLKSDWILPISEAKPILEAAGGDYRFDVTEYRTTNLKDLSQELDLMLKQKSEVIGHSLGQGYDFFMSVIMGSDRINHAFWKYVFQDHPLYKKHLEFEDFFYRYYKNLDGFLQNWYERALGLGYLPYILSDHGAKTLKGMFALNDWLIRQGYLVLRTSKEQGVLEAGDIDWSKTRVWSQGGYCGKLYFNRKGREKQGIVEDIDSLFGDLQRDFTALEVEIGLSFDLILPQKIYRRCSGFPPDAMIYVSSLDYRCAESLHQGRLILQENDTGPDGVNHDFMGIIASPDGLDPFKTIQDIAPEILRKFGVNT
jgi:predicted AlkP superfamily phosphohydrolase/phosphomutase